MLFLFTFFFVKLYVELLYRIELSTRPSVQLSWYWFDGPIPITFPVPPIGIVPINQNNNIFVFVDDNGTKVYITNNKKENSNE